MGTAKTAPRWFVEIALMEQFGWTEPELYATSWSRIQQISEYNRIKSIAEDTRAKRNQYSQQGQKIVTETFGSRRG